MTEEQRAVKGERRWPAALGILFLIVLPLVLPERLTLGPKWFLPLAEAIFLTAIVVRDPGRIDRRSGQMRHLSVGLLALFILGDIAMTSILVSELIRGAPELNEAGPLLATGSLVWINNNVLFGPSTGSSTAEVRQSAPSTRGGTQTWRSPST
jgi:hypothetical protein